MRKTHNSSKFLRNPGTVNLRQLLKPPGLAPLSPPSQILENSNSMIYVNTPRHFEINISGVTPLSFPMKCLITAGPTRQYIDEIRYISNGASGRFGIEIARECKQQNHSTELILGPTHLQSPESVPVQPVISAEEMYSELEQRFSSCDVLVMSAAVCDISPRNRIEGKQSKKNFNDSLEIQRTRDLLKDIAEQKENQFLLGFCLTNSNPRENAQRKLEEKDLDAIVINPPEALGAHENHITLLTKHEEVYEWGPEPKSKLARRLVEWLENEAM